MKVKNQKNKTIIKAKNNKPPQKNSQKQKTHYRETNSTFPKDFSHAFYLFPYQKLLGIIHLRY